MSITINVSDSKLADLSNPAKEELVSATTRYAEDIIDEANRLEAADRDAYNRPEITRSTIKDAVLYLRKYPKRPRRGPSYIILQIVSAISMLLTGCLFNVDKFKTDTNWLIWFLVILAVALTSTTSVFIMGRTE